MPELGPIYGASEGEVLLGKRRISGSRPHVINRIGVARTFQNTELFGGMTAVENVLVGSDRYHSYGGVAAVLRGPRFETCERLARDEAVGLLDAVGLADDADELAATLPFGKQRRLEIARALASRPKLLLLDEPAAGLRAAEIGELNRVLLDLSKRQGMTIVLIDHVMALVMTISDRISVLSFGRKIAEGSPAEVRSSPEVVKAYLGEKAAHAIRS